MIDTSKVNKKAVQKLLKGLRSGKYKQGFACLRPEDCYCVLGVACDVSGRCEWKINERGSFTYDNEATYTSDRVLEYYGFPRFIFGGFAVIKENGEEEAVSYLNDVTGLSFSELADLIETTYLKKEETK